jgi:beta-glucanase (GH16 family)
LGRAFTVPNENATLLTLDRAGSAMKRTTWFFLALALAASANCQVKGDGLNFTKASGTGSGGATGTGGTFDSGFASLGTGGLSEDGGIGSGGAAALDGAINLKDGQGSTALDVSANLEGGQGSGGIKAIDSATSTGGRIGSGGSTGSDSKIATSDASGTGGSPSPDGPDDTTSAQGDDALADTAPGEATSVAIDATNVQGPDAPTNSPDASEAADAAPTSDTIVVDSGMTLVWSDEFKGEANSGVDPTKWNHVTWNPGQVNHELQKYTDRLDNVFVDGENLVIRALNTPYGNNTYTSGRIESNGHFSFKFGRIEVRAKLPAGIGSFPGIIMMGTSGNWPQCGELALVEQYGHDKSSFYVDAYASTTTNGSGNTGSIKYTFPDADTASNDFHIYALDWHSDHIAFQVDGIEITRTTFNTSSPFYTIPEYIVLDVALGGDMGLAIDSTSVFPMDMVVDYVRVYSF